jgi:uncharacterized membrane protein
MDPFSPIRATTVHPALVHVTLGVVPVIVIAYAVALARKSERWSFAGDVALWIGAAFTVATLASGLVSNALVPWPAGLATWRWLHLGAAVASTAVFLALAAARWRRARRRELAGGGTLAAAVAVAVLLAVTGWIGGEVLVFHSGIAVRAAAQGALAPTIARARTPPRDLRAGMAALRGAWAEATTAYYEMLVQRPTAAGYARIASAARDLTRLAEWLQTEAPRHAAARGDPDAVAVSEHMARTLRDSSAGLDKAATARRWEAVTKSLGAVTAACAGCHEGARWTGEHQHGTQHAD